MLTEAKELGLSLVYNGEMNKIQRNAAEELKAKIRYFMATTNTLGIKTEGWVAGVMESILLYKELPDKSRLHASYERLEEFSR